MRYRKITQHQRKITSDCARSLLPIPNLQYRDMVKSDPVINNNNNNFIHNKIPILVHNEYIT